MLVQKYSIEPNYDLQKYKIQAKISIRNDFIRNWYSSIQNQSKNPICRTYSLFKLKFQTEPYLNKVSDPKLRRALVPIRTSSHALGIETSRHARKYKQNDSNRLCSVAYWRINLILYNTVPDIQKLAENCMITLL